MNLNQLDIIVSNIPQVCADLEHILDKKADYVDDSFAQFTIGSHCLMLSQIIWFLWKTFSQESFFISRLKM